MFDLLALVGRVFGLVRAVVESSFEQLDGDHSKDELEQHVDDHNIDDVLEGIHDAVKYRLNQHSTTA